jgi:hypothetical protein
VKRACSTPLATPSTRFSDRGLLPTTREGVPTRRAARAGPASRSARAPLGQVLDSAQGARRRKDFGIRGEGENVGGPSEAAGAPADAFWLT